MSSVYGIYAPYATAVTIRGGGSLVVSAEYSEITSYGESSGIFVDKGSLTLENVTVTATGANLRSTGDYESSSLHSFGVYAKGLTVTNSTLTATGGNVTYEKCLSTNSVTGESYGIFCSSTDEIIVNSGTVEATGGNVTITGNKYWSTDADSYGIYGYLTVNGGTVTATCGEASYVGGQQAGYTRTSAVTSYGTEETVTLGEGITAKASTNADGTDSETYNAQNKDNYKYFKAEAAEQ